MLRVRPRAGYGSGIGEMMMPFSVLVVEPVERLAVVRSRCPGRTRWRSLRARGCARPGAGRRAAGSCPRSTSSGCGSPLEAGNVGYLTRWSGSDMCCCSADARSVSRVQPAAVIASTHLAPRRPRTRCRRHRRRPGQHDNERDGERDDADEAGADEDVRARHREAPPPFVGCFWRTLGAWTLRGGGGVRGFLATRSAQGIEAGSAAPDSEEPAYGGALGGRRSVEGGSASRNARP